jgi:nitrite reductase/ring-hydroxylating ferredoxin subunit
VTAALQDRLIRRFWHLLAHRSELARPKDYLRLSWAAGEIALYNDGGAVVAFDNVCPHRGARFFVEDAGSAPAACPYHGWTYRGGTLRTPPGCGLAPEALARARLNTFETAWCGDWLFAAVAPEETLERQLDALAPRLAGLSQDIEGRRDLNAYPFECDWRVAVENALEADHIDLVHPETLRALALEPGRFEFAGRNSAWVTEVGDPRRAKALRSLGRLFDAPHAYPGYVNLFVFPFAMVSSTFGLSYSLQTFMPAAEPGRTHFCSRLLGARPSGGQASAAVDALMASTAEMNRQVFEEDHRICRRVSPAYDMEAPDRLFGASEARLAHFHRELAALREGDTVDAPRSAQSVFSAAAASLSARPRAH